MQTGNAEIRAQQLVLAYLGFYNGVIDGTWSDASIRAMKAFECDDSFLPAVPTNGLPFPVNAKLPKGMFWDKKLVSHRKMTTEDAKAILAARTPATKPVTTTTFTSAPAATTESTENLQAQKDSSYNPDLSNAQQQDTADVNVDNTAEKGSNTVEKTVGTTSAQVTDQSSTPQHKSPATKNASK